MAYNKTHKRRRPHKQNRLWSETNHTFAVPTNIASVFAFLFVVAIAYAALSHSRDALFDEIGRAERSQETLLQDLDRETTAWDRLRAPRNLEATLRNNGIAMKATPRGHRIAMGGFAAPAGPVRADALRGPSALAANL
ncbi:MAG: hypothetical protein IJV65_00565 [Kiritimatiellae bacterium]|nr:hypothetical protein [Kiritimatiellia bacterium]